MGRASATRRSLTRRLRHRLRPAWTRPLAWLARTLLPPLYLAYMRLVFATSQVDDSRFGPVYAQRGRGAVCLLWHEEVFAVAYVYGVHAKLRLITLASAGDAGEVIARILARCGFHVVRGGSTRHRSRRRPAAFLVLLRAARSRPDALIGITVDGSKGPAHAMKPGGPLLAARTGVPILLVRCDWSRGLRLRTWDRSRIPLPCGRIVLRARGPIPVPAGLEKATVDDPAFERWRQELESELRALGEE